MNELIRNKLFRFKRNKEEPLKTEFDYLIGRARYFFDQSRLVALRDLQQLVIRPLQSQHLVAAYLKPDNGAPDEIDILDDFGLLMIPTLNQSFTDFINNHQIAEEALPQAYLGRDAVLPTCWSPASIKNNLGILGKHRGMDAWQYDSTNHKIAWCYPLNVFFVEGGNHSITQGILQAEGVVKAIKGYDLSGLYQYVKFDGESWVDLQTESHLGKPRYKELGYLFEIGRLILMLEQQQAAT